MTDAELDGPVKMARLRAFRYVQPGGLGRATLLVSLSSSASRLLGLLASLVGAAALGPHTLGVFAFMTVTASVLASLGVLGFGPLVTRQIADSETSKHARDAATFALGATTTLLLSIGVGYCIVADPNFGVFHLAGVESRAAVITVAAWGVAFGLNAVLAAVIAGNRAFGRLARIAVFRAGVGALASAAVAVATGSALDTAIASAAAEVLTVAITLIVARADFHGGSIATGWRSGGGNLLKASVGAGAASLLIQGSIWGSQYLLLQTSNGYAENGGFSLANRLVLLVTFFPNSLAAAALPFLSDRTTPTDNRRRARAVARGSTLTAIPIAIVLAAISSLILKTLGHGYDAYAETLQIMCLAGLAIAMNNLLGTAAVVTGLIRLWVLSDVVLAVLIIGISALTVHSLGANGVAIAYVCAYAASAAMLWPALTRLHTGAGQEDVRPT